MKTFSSLTRGVQLYFTLHDIIGLQRCNVTRKPRALRSTEGEASDQNKRLKNWIAADEHRSEEARRVTTLCLQN